MTVSADEIALRMTCGSCPEQYEATFKGVEVGYLRLRHGCFYACCPDVSGVEVFEAYPKGDGVFETDERDFYLTKAKEAIADWLNAKGEQAA
jgi:hypothetical protein